MSIEKEIITGTLYSPDEVSEIVIDDFSFQGTWTDSDTTLPSSVSSNTAFENVCATSKITVSGGTAGFKKVYFDTTESASIGGALRLNAPSSIIISGSTFVDNATTNYGGAIYSGTTGNVKIADSLFANNSAADRGGALMVNNVCFFVISGSTFSGNKATAGEKNGGAIYINNAGAELTVSGSTFTGNETAHSGGAIYNKGTLTVQNAIFSGNKATYYGGAIFVTSGSADISGATFSGNKGNDSAYGGAIYAKENTVVTIKNSVFATKSDTIATCKGSVTITGTNTINTDIVNDRGTILASGAVITFDNASSIDIKGLSLAPASGNKFLFSGKSVTFKNADFSDIDISISLECLAEAGQTGKTVAVISGITKMQETITVDGKTVNLGEELKIGDNTFKFTFADSNLNLTWTGSSTAATIYSQNGVSGVFIQDEFYKASSIGDINNIPDQVKNSVFTDFTETSKRFYVYDCSFSVFNNMSICGLNNQSGGAVRSDWANVKVFGSTFAQNQSNLGGAIYFANAGNRTLTVKDSLFVENHATIKGGALMINSKNSNVEISGSTFYGNTDPYGGAAIQLNDASILTVSGSTFATASDTIFVEKGELIFKNRNVINATVKTYNATITASNAQLEFDNIKEINIAKINFTTPENAENTNSVTFSGSKIVKFSDVALENVAVNVTLDCLIESRNVAFTIASGISSIGTVTVDNNDITVGTAFTVDGGDFRIDYNATDKKLTATSLTNIYSANETTEAVVGGEVFKGAYAADTTLPLGEHIESRTAIIGVSIENSNKRISFKNTVAGLKNVNFSNAVVSDDNGAAMKIQINTSTPRETAVYIENSKFSNNINTKYGGGAIYLLSGECDISSNTEFSGNTVAGNGGAIYNAANGILTVSDATFSGNTANFGGAVYNLGTAEISDTVFAGNTAAGRGGAVYSNTGSITLTDVLFYQNKSTSSAESGGALIVDSGVANISGATFYQNTSKHGALFAHGAGTTNISGSTFATADDFIYSYNGTVNFSGKNVINANIVKGGGKNVSFNVKENAELVFDNSTAINIAGLTFSGSNALKFSGVQVNFKESGGQNLDNISITVDASLIPETGKYVIASGISSMENVTITVGTETYTPGVLKNDCLFALDGTNFTVTTILQVDEVYVGYSGKEPNFATAAEAAVYLKSGGKAYISNVWEQKSTSASGDATVYLLKHTEFDGSVDISVSGIKDVDRFYASGKAVTGDLSFTVTDVTAKRAVLSGDSGNTLCKNATLTVIDSTITEQIEGGGSGGKTTIDGNMTITVKNSTVGTIYGSRGDIINGDIAIYLDNATISAIANNIDKNMTLTVSGDVSIGSMEKVSSLAINENGKIAFTGDTVDLSSVNITINTDAFDFTTDVITVATGVSSVGSVTLTGDNAELFTYSVSNNNLYLVKKSEISGTKVVGENGALLVTGGGITGTAFSSAVYQEKVVSVVTGGTIGKNLLGGVWSNGEVAEKVESVSLDIAGGEVKGYVYSGGYLIGSGSDIPTEAQMNVGNVALTLTGGEISKDIYGGIHVRENGYGKADSVAITINGNGVYGNVFGGGWAEQNAKSEVGAVTISVTGGEINRLFAGGGASLADTTNISSVGTSEVTISGGIVNYVYLSGLNQQTAITGSVQLTVDAENSFKLITGYDFNGADSTDVATGVAIKANVTCNTMSNIETLTIGENCTLTLGNAADIDEIVFDADGEFDWTALSADNLESAFASTVFHIGDASYEGLDALIASDFADFGENNKSIILKKGTLA